MWLTNLFRGSAPAPQSGFPWIKFTFAAFGVAAVLFGGGYFFRGSAELVESLDDSDSDDEDSS